MKRVFVVIGLLLMAAVLLVSADKPKDYEKYWHQWRGPYMTGVSPYGNPPLEWSETKNIKWKIDTPGKGHSTPIIWKDRIFLLTAVEVDDGKTPENPAEKQQGGRRGMPSRRTNKVHKFVVLALNRADGRTLWQRAVAEEIPQEATHDLGSWASNSPVTDGEFIYAYFGSRGLYCLDMDGEVKWERDFGQMSKRMEFGEGSSPALHGDKLFVVWDHQGDSFIVAVDKKTGKDIWKVERDEITSWSTPLIVEVNGKPQVIVSATKRVRGYDLDTGDLIWEAGGMTDNVIPVPLEADGILYVMSGFRGNALLAIRLADAKEDITASDAIVWSLDKDTSYAPSGLLYEDNLYFLRSNNGILNCFDAKTGKEYYSGERLEGLGNLYSSPTAAQNRIYIIGNKGLTFVVQHGTEFKILAQNQLDDNFNASPVILDNEIYLRGYDKFYCIAEK